MVDAALKQICDMGYKVTTLQCNLGYLCMTKFTPDGQYISITVQALDKRSPSLAAKSLLTKLRNLEKKVHHR